MSALLTVLAASVTTFAATNLDDIFLLTVFFTRRVSTRRIVAVASLLALLRFRVNSAWLVVAGASIGLITSAVHLR